MRGRRRSRKKRGRGETNECVPEKIKGNTKLRNIKEKKRTRRNSET